MTAVLEAVIFDFYGTLAHWADTGASSYTSVFAAFGYELDPSVLDGYFSRYDGIDHAEHSISEEAYEAWVRWRLGEFSASCGVDEKDMEDVVDALRQLDQAQMGPIPRRLPPFDRCGAQASPSACVRTGAGSSMPISKTSDSWTWSTRRQRRPEPVLESPTPVFMRARPKPLGSIRIRRCSWATRGSPTSGVLVAWE